MNDTKKMISLRALLVAEKFDDELTGESKESLKIIFGITELISRLRQKKK